jgi:hypothetical protein
MQFSWAKLDDTDPGGPGWAVRVTTYRGGGHTALGYAGQTVQVEARSGKSKQVTLGSMLSQANGGRWAIYSVAAQERTGREVAKVAAQAAARHRAQTPPPAPTPIRDRKLTPAQDAKRLPDGSYDAYDILLGTPGVPGRYRTIERAVEFLVDGWVTSWWPGPDKPVFDTAVEAAREWLAEEGRVLNEQVAYERANGWSTE